MRHRFHVRRCPHLFRNVYSALTLPHDDEPWVYRQVIRHYNSMLYFPGARDSDILYQLLWGKGWSLLWLGRVEQAKRCFLRSLRVNPALPNSHLWLSVVYRVEGKHEAAASSLERGLQCESHNLQETIGYWRALCDLGWDEEAERVRAFIYESLEMEMVN